MTGYEPGDSHESLAQLKSIQRNNLLNRQMSTFHASKTSLDAIPVLKGRENYKNWARQMESHLKASKAWEIIEGEWKRPAKPKYHEVPIFPQELIEEHKAEYLANNPPQVVDEDGDTPSSSQSTPTYIAITIKEAKEQLGYIKA